MATKTTVQNRNPLALERQVCFALEVTTRAVLAVYRPLLEPLGLPHPQYLVMMALWGHPRSSPEPLSVKQIAAALHLDSGTLWPMLKRLEVRGLIARSRGTTGEGTTHVKLTADGVALRRRALKIPPAVVERLGVDLDELERLHEVLTRINAAALAAGPFADEWIDRRRDRKCCSTSPIASAVSCRTPCRPGLATTSLVTNRANRVFLRNWREALKVPKERHRDTFVECGNLFAAGIPVNLDRAITDGQLKKGDVVMMAAFAPAGDFAGGVVRWGGRL